MKKFLALAVALLISVMSLCACSDKGETVTPAVSDILTQMEQNVTIPNATRIDDTDNIYTMYDLDASMIAEIGMIKSGNGANADEIIVVKVNDKANLSKVQDAFTQRLQVMTDLFENYTPEDMPKIENAACITSSDYIMLAVCEDPDSAVKVFKESFTKK